MSDERVTLIDPRKVEELYDYCIFRPELDRDNLVHLPDHLYRNVVDFNPRRLNEVRHEIVELLSRLPDSYSKSKGGGCVLDANVDIRGVEWTSHSNKNLIAKLMMLGLVIGKVEYRDPYSKRGSKRSPNPIVFIV
jgi:hypothetical protein